MFLSVDVLAQVRLGRTYCRYESIDLTSLMAFAVPAGIATDSPLIALGRDYSGEAAIPESPHQEGTNLPLRRQSLFVVDLWV